MIKEDEDEKSVSNDADYGGRRENESIRKMFMEIVKMLPDRGKVKTDLLYFKYVPILVMLMRWYGTFQFYDNKMEITLWYEQNEEPIWFFYLITYVLYPISLWKGQLLHRLCVEWRIPLFYAIGVNIEHLMFGSVIIKNEMYHCDMFLICMTLCLYAYVAARKLQDYRGRTSCPCR